MSTLYVRWLGAYGGHETGLDATLKFEGSSVRERACEFIHVKHGKAHTNVGSHVRCLTGEIRVGLVFDRIAIMRKYSGDVWSKTTESGRLKAGRKPVKSGHTEAFIAIGTRPTAIIISNIGELRRYDAAILRKFIISTGITAVYTGDRRGNLNLIANRYDWFMARYAARTRRTPKMCARVRPSRWRISKSMHQRLERRGRRIPGRHLTSRTVYGCIREFRRRSGP